MSGSGAYIEMLPPDRPIHMIGQPIIKLVADGGPGGDLGDLPAKARSRSRPPVAKEEGFLSRLWSGLRTAIGAGPALGQYNPALQQELSRVAEGSAPDVSAEYFRPMDVPGLAPDREGPHTGRQGVYPKKLRDMVEYDMSGMACTPSDLGCCGADGDMGNYGMPMGNYGMGQFVKVTDIVRQRGVDAGAGLGQFVAVTDAGSGMGQFVKVTDFVRQRGVDAGGMADEAKLLDGHCDGLEKKANDIVDAVKKASANTSLSPDQKAKIASDARVMLDKLKADWKSCRSRLKQIIAAFKKSGDLKKFGLAGIDAEIEKEDKVAQCRAKLRAIRKIAANGDGMGEPWNGRAERGSWNH